MRSVFSKLMLLGLLLWNGVGCERKQNEPAELVIPQRLFEHKCAFSYQDRDRLQCFDYYTEPQQQGFRIPVVIIRNYSLSRFPPLVYLSGGPGATHVSHSDSVSYWMNWLDSVSLERDLVLFDLRGAAAGEPSWQCNNYEELSKELLRKNLTVEEETRLTYPVLERCLQTFDNKLQRAVSGNSRKSPGSGVRTISTRNYAQDVSGIMQSLGFEKWSIMASSYGTRLGMQIAATNGNVDKLLLDSPYPSGHGQMDDAFRVWVSAFEFLFEKFADQEVEALYWQALEKLKQQPVRVTVQNWQTRADVKWLLNDARLNWVIYQAMYSKELFMQIPGALQSLNKGRLEQMQPLLESFYNNAFDRFFNSMIFVATECNDNWSTSQEDFERALQEAPQWAPYFAKDWQYNICATDVFNAKIPLLRSRFAQPTLVIAGEMDPITNTDYARDTLALADRAEILYAKGLSHAEFIDSECGKPVIVDFFKSGEKLDVKLVTEQFMECQQSMNN